ncbi:regulator of microtubule dynamics protein 3 isoform X2 [Hemicordylus capensis]|nr:regulator of microtubule dynamics protein 3 isoform X2 [Hemicordylus capensis]XP_053139991.1 regulator of microtubule dynamics protein 3 isoform X2 [Hemicordylus capensis]XP_053139992.1 regulator of microtubule dynamics protein 3 isoform X2 [Hemicordylus capensis]XP_053139993.1 regulator of microtubule dynamics protein 3 isoform X2 [Hemicordylus capensis]XP_053139995.1 regulator of microtubule dynamics protein 3 isoform X2 [Hemicordylus capensis]XP_053139996.1 regulator of microtubule dynam
MSKLEATRVGLGVVLGAAAGIGLFYHFYKRSRKKPWWLESSRPQNIPVLQNALNPQEHTETLQPYNQGPWMRQGPVEGGDSITHSTFLTHEEQTEVLNRLDFVLKSIIELRSEVEELRNSLQGLAGEIAVEIRSQLEESQKATRRRRFVFSRERSDSTGSSSIYFTTSSGTVNADDGESEGGYTTANAESDYDRESEKESEEGEDEISCETVRTARRDSLDLVNEDETTLTFDSAVDEELAQLLQQADHLHRGSDQEKKEGFQLLLNNKLMYGSKQDFLWRLARAHSDMCEITEDADEKKACASDGKEEAETALQMGDQSAECHQWYAVLCGQFSEHESIQKRIQAGHIFKQHIDKAIALKPDDPKSFYLLGRWCYQVSHLGWLERKTASALYEEPPTASVQDALTNFLKAEELSSGFSKMGRVYIAKCYRELGDNSTADHWLSLASELPVITKEDEESNREIEALHSISED